MSKNSIHILSFALFYLILTKYNNIAYCQMTVEIELSGTQKQKKETKKFLENYDIYFCVKDEEIRGCFFNDNLLKMDSISSTQIENLKSKKFILVKFSNKKECHYSLFPNLFTKPSSIMQLFIYRVYIKKRILGIINIYNKSNYFATNLSYTEKGLSIVRPFTMIHCNEYNGVYENDW